jgi:2-oxoglutarate-dependent dioxygenase
VVTRAEASRFRRDGFIAIDRPAIPEAALRPARQLLDALFGRAHELPMVWVHDLAPEQGRATVPEIVNSAHLEPRLLKTRAYRLALRAAQRLVGGPVQLAFDHAIFKPARSEGTTALHQDLAFDPTWDVPAATIWLALVDATEENGCMRFVEKTPEGLLNHAAVGRDGLGVVGLDAAAARPRPVPAGGFTAHNQRAVHGTGSNTTSEVRAAWILKFVRDDRSRRRRAWERSLELQGVVVPRRFDELCAAVSQSNALPRRNPEWVEAQLGAARQAGAA